MKAQIIYYNVKFPHKKIVVRKRLDSCGFTDGETPALGWIRMDVVMPILRNVRYDSAARRVCELDAEAINVWGVVVPSIRVIWKKLLREISQGRRPSGHPCET